MPPVTCKTISIQIYIQENKNFYILVSMTLLKFNQYMLLFIHSVDLIYEEYEHYL